MKPIALHPYQQYAKDFLIRTKKCGLFLDCGLGKTLITLLALLEINPKGHVLIIAPKSIARSTWMDEMEKWGIRLRTRSLIVNENGTSLTRKKRLERYEEIKSSLPTVYFINNELVTDLVEYLAPEFPFVMVVIDEIHKFKKYNTNRFKALSKAAGDIDRFVGLTGTPMPNGLEDLWPEIYFMDGGKRLGKNITAYRNRWFTPGLMGPGGYPVNWKPRPGAEEEIYDAIKDLVVSIKNPNIKLPEISYNDTYVYMEEKEKKIYDELLRTRVLELKETDGEEITITASHAADLQLKLSQMASGALYLPKESEENASAQNYTVIHEKKIDMCRYIIENTGASVLIAYYFQSDKDMLLKNIPEARLFNGTPEMVHAWNKGEIPVMLLHPIAHGAGINLQEGGSTILWYTLPWSLEAYLQTNARIYRQGQQKPVVIHHILTDGTVDNKILSALERKDINEQALLDAVSAAIRKE